MRVKLNQEQRNDIIAMYEYVLSQQDDNGVAHGAHAELLACLDRHGIKCNSTTEAMRIACDIANGAIER